MGGAELACILPDIDVDSGTKRSIMIMDNAAPPAEIQTLTITGKLAAIVGPTVKANEMPAKFKLSTVARLPGLTTSDT